MKASDPAIDDFERRLETLAVILDEQAVLQGAGETVAAGLELDVCWVSLPTDPDTIVVRHLYGARTTALRGLVVPRGWGVSGKSFAQGNVTVVNDYLAAADITHHFDEIMVAEELQRLMAAPVIVDEQIVAVICGAGRGLGAFGDRVMAQLETASRRTSAALRAAGRARRLADSAVQRDRDDVAASLHDSVGAMLFAIQASVRELSLALHDQAVLLAKAEAIESQAIEATRALRDSLLAMSLPSRGLALEVELQGDCHAFEQRTSIPTSFLMLDSDLPGLDEARAAALLGAAREALLNIEKHAAASAVVMTLGRSGEVLQLTVTDNGHGPLGDERSPGLGLREQRRRFARLGGAVTLDRLEDGGSVFRALLPVVD